ncbi:uncharacterized protein LOC129807174 isoform X2 [Phlebotomus papatasi]|uniref:uncharacterized protein LOC129807174 isoform X2 n=1 Tax=Phlebotomus papatasi TaxID=29031 RepID=UPI0024836352|nr:uncharacterized protein LOC129807174 isoform X2 [Phlebotomus papatasi]
MAKAARRSVASDPSSPTSYTRYYPPRYTTEPLDRRRHANGPLRYHPPEAVISRTDRTTPSPHSISRFDNASTSTIQPPANGTVSPESVAAERERIRMEFYATYDVMTGVRIAATLGGFFGLMVILVMYKSRSHSNSALKDPNIAAVAAAVVQEEEERELQEVLEASGLTLYSDDYRYDFQRRRLLSLGNVSAPPALHRGLRFSSFGGYSSLMDPPRRYSYGGTKPKCSPESSRILSAYQMGDSFGIDDFIESDDEHEVDDFDQTTITAESGYPSHLSVPQKQYDSRRSSGITCCSTESSYLERRCSSITLGIHSLAPISSHNHSRRSSRDAWDVSNFPDINIIQPTPKTSPCPSEGNINERTKIGSTVRLRRSHEPTIESFDYISEYPDTNGEEEHRERSVEDSVSGSTRRAPLASLSSFKISSIDYQDSDLRSLGSDSVFVESYADTDEDMEQFSTDSDDASDGPTPPHTKRATIGEGLLLRPSVNLSTNRDNSCSSDNLPKSNSSAHLSKTFQTKAVIERRLDDADMDTGACPSSISNSKAMVKSKSAEECIVVSVVADPDRRSTNSGPAVILELPVITTQQQVDEQPIDPSVPGPSRKWSKETLF